MIELLINLIVSVMAAATPLLLAATGELIVEKVAVLNLGVEGMMLMGAIAGFAVAHETGNLPLALLAAVAAGMALSYLFAVLTLTLQANQTATGLALTIFGPGRCRICWHRGADHSEDPSAGAVRPAVLRGDVVQL